MTVFVALVVAGPDTKIVGVCSEYYLALALAKEACVGYHEGSSVPLVQKHEVDKCERV